MAQGDPPRPKGPFESFLEAMLTLTYQIRDDSLASYQALWEKASAMDDRFEKAVEEFEFDDMVQCYREKGEIKREAGEFLGKADACNQIIEGIRIHMEKNHPD